MKLFANIREETQQEVIETEFDELTDNTLLPDTSELLIEKEQSSPDGLPILVYEEDAMSRLLIGFILYHNNISFELATSLEELKEKLHHRAFGLVIAGINGKEPDLSGVFNKQIPALAVTASTGDKEIEHYLAAGYEYVLTEPYEDEELIHQIHTYMKKSYNTPHENVSTTEPTSTLSLEPLQKICKGDTAFILKMLDKFLISVDECTEGLRSGDPTKIKTAAHKSIPSYSIMGLEGMVTDLGFIEHHVEEEGDKEKVEMLTKKMLTQNEALVHEVHEHIDRLKNKLNT